jgi:hypothetical protein
MAWRRIDRRLVHSEEVFLLLARDGQQGWPSPETMQAVEAAVEHANDNAEIWYFDHIETAGRVRASDVCPSPFGPVIYLDKIGRRVDNRRWLSVFAHRLQKDGHSGVLDVAPRAGIPAFNRSAPGPAAYLAYRTDDQPAPTSWQPRERWGVDADTTVDFCRRLTGWATLPEAEVRLDSGMSHVKIEDPDPCGQLIPAMALTYSAGVSFIRRNPLHVRHAALSWSGQVAVQTEGQHLDWSTKVEALVEVLRWHPDKLDLAFIRLTRNWARSWMDLANGFTKLPHVSEGDVRSRRDLWQEYIPDAHGVQVLTDAHLARANNLDAWHVQALTPTRYLVQAKDLQPWYGTGTDPAADVLTAARDDFGDMLLTIEVIKNRPRP